jgi:phospholipid-binding lipoprotein MlaA
VKFQMNIPKLSGLGLTAFVVLLQGCASTSISNRGVRNEIDPFETYNRTVFVFNDAADRIVLKPIATVYDRVTPEVLRYVIGNFFSNLGEIGNGVNSLLQLKGKQAINDGARLLINSTLGFGGLADVASELGLERSNEDVGQTLGFWGVPAGPYFVLPLLGPTSGRDLAGTFAGYGLYPLNRYNPKTHRFTLNMTQLVDTRANLLGASKLMDGAALDSYTFMRNAYFQRRLSLVYDGNPPFHSVPQEDKDDPPKTDPAEKKVDSGQPK